MIARSHIKAYSQWCGPSVLASVTGLTSYAAAAALWAVEPPTGRRRNETKIETLAKALGRNVSEVTHTDEKTRGTMALPTVARWLRTSTDREAILLAANHFIHVRHGLSIQDNGHPKRRGRVCWVIYLDG